MSHRSRTFANSTSDQLRFGFAKIGQQRHVASRVHRHLLASEAIAALMMGGGVLSLLVAAPAHADGSATVKTKTQRMSDANLSSQQNGWYNPGDQLTLVCSRRGQNVKGFFSFNIPGGWDNLWYRTSDGNFVADVDIETGTLNDVANDCGIGGPTPAPPPAPAPNGDRASQAVSWARNQMATNPNSTIQCKEFVEAAYGTWWPGATALDLFKTLNGQHKINTDTNPPAGALVFSSDPRFDNHQGHVMLSEGNGKFITANYYVFPKVREVPLTYPGNQYLGWAYAP